MKATLEDETCAFEVHWMFQDERTKFRDGAKPWSRRLSFLAIEMAGVSGTSLKVGKHSW